MSAFWRTKKFKDLSKKWNKNLSDVGFEDAEIELKDDRTLKQRASNSYRQASVIEREAKLQYYILLGRLVSSTVFPSEIEQSIMTKHADGESIKEIVEELTGQGILIHRRTIGYIIRRWESKWGIKSWNLKQMNLKKAIGS